MRPLNKLAQQRRHQLHVHMPPSGLKEDAHGNGSDAPLPPITRELDQAGGRKPTWLARLRH